MRVLCLALLVMGLAVLLPFGAVRAEQPALFVGIEACADCHQKQHESFMANSRKAHSWRSIQKMAPKLTPNEVTGCYACHTTGYGQPGGFVSLEETPKLANVGCEACHGPGGRHSESGDPDDIRRRPDMDGCKVCHNEQRVVNFNFKPTLYHGGH